ncbi:MAG: hypothetical protein ACJA0U_000063 [Salibacteraceae bacterium]|jgi:hypothetical protein
MKNSAKYSYKLRPGYGSTELLLDLNCNGFPDSLQRDLFAIFEEENFKSVQSDLWIHDQIWFEYKSDNGAITISRDIWDFFFISGEDNQKDILKLDIILSENELFEKQTVDFSEYK